MRQIEKLVLVAIFAIAVVGGAQPAKDNPSSPQGRKRVGIGLILRLS